MTEHTANVAAQFADRWATAVAAQARRIRQPENILERVPDAWVQAITLRQLLRAAEMAKAAAGTGPAGKRIEGAIEAFIKAIVIETTAAGPDKGFRLARDVLEHFEDYSQGTGNLQQPGVKRSDRSPREDQARQYWMDLDGQADSALYLRIGPLRPAKPLVVIDLVEKAPVAARQLARALGLGDGAWAP